MKKIISIFLILFFLFPQSFAYDISKKELIISKYELKKEKKGDKYIKQIDLFLKQVKDKESILIKLKDKIDFLEEKFENRFDTKSIKIKKILKYLNLRLYYLLQNNLSEEDFSSLINNNIKKETILKRINPNVELTFLNNTGKIITRANLIINIVDDAGKVLLSDTITRSFSPGLLPKKEQKVEFDLGYKWTKDALKSTLGFSVIKSSNFIVRIEEIKDIDGNKFFSNGRTKEYKQDIKDKYAKVQEINEKIIEIQEKLKDVEEGSDIANQYSIEINKLSKQMDIADQYSFISVIYYDIQKEEIAESLKIQDVKFVAEE